jgi:hypothetical protein
VDGDRVEQVFIDDPAECAVVFALESNDRLEGFERLDRSLETDRSRFDPVFGCRLSDNCSDAPRLPDRRLKERRGTDFASMGAKYRAKPYSVSI